MKSRIAVALKEIAVNPASGKKLTGLLAGEYSWRVGDYRVLYTIADETVYLETVGHRKDVYRR